MDAEYYEVYYHENNYSGVFLCFFDTLWKAEDMVRLEYSDFVKMESEGLYLPYIIISNPNQLKQTIPPICFCKKMANKN